MYTIVVEKDEVAKKIVEFSSDRKCLGTGGLTLVTNTDFNRYIGKNLNEIIGELGEVHADVGSGFYVPSYITVDGYLICFEIENDTVYEVIKRDLLKNVVVESLTQ